VEADTSSSADQIPRDTEYFIIDGAFNPRYGWVNSTDGTTKHWMAIKGVAPEMETAMGGPVTASPTATDAPTAVSTVAASSPSKDSGPEDYWQALSPHPETRCDIQVPEGVSFVIVNGSTGRGRTALAAGFLPSPPHPRPASNASNDPSITTEKFYSANNSWGTDTILFMRELDPTVRYTLSLQPAQGDQGNVGIHSITYLYGLAP
jgi:hypothetical protein